ncbi:MAG: hypothetical protein ACQEQ4_05215 [Fibrobacterota bacterium]
MLIFTVAAIILTIHVVLKSNTTEQHIDDLITKTEQHYDTSEGTDDEEKNR